MCCCSSTPKPTVQEEALGASNIAKGTQLELKLKDQELSKLS